MRSAHYAVVMPETSAVHGAGHYDAPARGLLLGAAAPGRRPKALHRLVRDVWGPSPWC